MPSTVPRPERVTYFSQKTIQAIQPFVMLLLVYSPCFYTVKLAVTRVLGPILSALHINSPLMMVNRCIWWEKNEKNVDECLTKPDTQVMFSFRWTGAVMTQANQTTDKTDHWVAPEYDNENTVGNFHKLVKKVMIKFHINFSFCA